MRCQSTVPCSVIGLGSGAIVDLREPRRLCHVGRDPVRQPRHRHSFLAWKRYRVGFTRLLQTLVCPALQGVILYGEPGTGKTLLAKAVANSTSATFLRVVGSELIQKYLGDGPKLVRELFRVADELAPSIVFIGAPVTAPFCRTTATPPPVLAQPRMKFCIQQGLAEVAGSRGSRACGLIWLYQHG